MGPGNPLPHVCVHIARAQNVLNKCDVHPVLPDGHELLNVDVIVDDGQGTGTEEVWVPPELQVPATAQPQPQFVPAVSPCDPAPLLELLCWPPRHLLNLR